MWRIVRLKINFTYKGLKSFCPGDFKYFNHNPNSDYVINGNSASGSNGGSVRGISSGAWPFDEYMKSMATNCAYAPISGVPELDVAPGTTETETYDYAIAGCMVTPGGPQ